MKIHQISLYQFRNYAEVTIPFKKRLTLICGKNAYGKTNILEAISMLSYGKSFRDAAPASLIMHNQAKCSIRGDIEQEYDKMDKILLSIENKNSKSSKQVFLNGKKLRSLSELMGRLVTVYFTPNDVALVDGSASIRRRFFDEILCMSDRSYLQSLLTYNKILSQRNALLKRFGGIGHIEKELDQWDDQLTVIVPAIRQARKNFLPMFQNFLEQSVQKISGEQDHIDIENEDILQTPEDYQNKIQSQRQKDYQYRYTTIGPHRDHYQLKCQNRPFAAYASQGQKRSVALALRYAQFEYLRDTLGDQPVLLIDDVMPELDRERRRLFLELLTNSGQGLITLPDLNDVKSELTGLQQDIEVIHLKNPATICFQPSL